MSWKADSVSWCGYSVSSGLLTVFPGTWVPFGEMSVCYNWNGRSVGSLIRDLQQLCQLPLRRLLLSLPPTASPGIVALVKFFFSESRLWWEDCSLSHTSNGACASGVAGMEVRRLRGRESQDSPSAQDLQRPDREGRADLWGTGTFIPEMTRRQSLGFNTFSSVSSSVIRRRRFTKGRSESPWSACWPWAGASTGPRTERACLIRGKMRKWERSRIAHR